MIGFMNDIEYCLSCGFLLDYVLLDFDMQSSCVIKVEIQVGRPNTKVLLRMLYMWNLRIILIQN